MKYWKCIDDGRYVGLYTVGRIYEGGRMPEGQFSSSPDKIFLVQDNTGTGVIARRELFVEVPMDVKVGDKFLCRKTLYTANSKIAVKSKTAAFQEGRIYEAIDFNEFDGICFHNESGDRHWTSILGNLDQSWFSYFEKTEVNTPPTPIDIDEAFRRDRLTASARLNPPLDAHGMPLQKPATAPIVVPMQHSDRMGIDAASMKYAGM